MTLADDKMIKIEIYTKDVLLDWNSFIDNAKNSHFFFRREYMDYHKDRFQDFSLMIYNEKGKLIAVLPANVSMQNENKILQSHGGLTFGGFLVGQDMTTATMLEIFDAVKTFLRQRNFSSMIYKCIPYVYWKYPCEEDKYALFVNKAKLIRRDVSVATFIPYRYGYHAQRARSIKKAVKNNIIVRQSAAYEDFIDLENAVLSKYHSAIAVHTGQELRLLAERFPENIKLYTGELDGKILAGAVIFDNGDTVHTQYLANSDEGRKIGALDGVIDHLLKEVYFDRKYFDFGISNEQNGRYLNRGLISQKEGFGARAVVHDFYKMDF